MNIFELRDELRNPLKSKLRHGEAPFKQSMITVMRLSKDQEEKLLTARKTFLRQCDRLRKQRETSTLDIKRASRSALLVPASDSARPPEILSEMHGGLQKSRTAHPHHCKEESLNSHMQQRLHAPQYVVQSLSAAKGSEGESEILL